MAIKANIYNQDGKAVSEIELAESVFGAKVNEALVHQAMVAQMSNERHSIAHTKIRSEVRGGGRKPWRQKGTGRARAGSIRSPIWIGGGITFGPRKDRNFSKGLNKKMRQKALCAALSDKVKSGGLAILDELAAEEYKTQSMRVLLEKLEKAAFGLDKQSKRSILVINDKSDDKTKNSLRNLEGVRVINLENINLLDLLKYRHVLITRKSVEKLQDKYSQ